MAAVTTQTIFEIVMLFVEGACSWAEGPPSYGQNGQYDQFMNSKDAKCKELVMLLIGAYSSSDVQEFGDQLKKAYAYPKIIPHIQSCESCKNDSRLPKQDRAQKEEQQEKEETEEKEDDDQN